MLEALVALLIVTTWFRLRNPMRDWYVVEWRRCSSRKLTEIAFPTGGEMGFSKYSLSHANFWVESKALKGPWYASRMRHKDGGYVDTDQTVYEHLNAALIYFETIKGFFQSQDTYQKVYLWRTVARSHKRAAIIPYDSFELKEAILLDDHPRFCFYEFPITLNDEEKNGS